MTARLGGYSDMFTVFDAYGFTRGPDARLVLLDLRTMKIIADQPTTLDEMIEMCASLE